MRIAKIVALLLLTACQNNDQILNAGLRKDPTWEYNCYIDEFTDVRTCVMKREGAFVRLSNDKTLLIEFGLNNHPSVKGVVRIDNSKAIYYEGTFIKGAQAKLLLAQMLKGKRGIAKTHQWPYDSKTIEFSLTDFKGAYQVLQNMMSD